MGSGLPDPATAPASTAPVPQTAFENKPPPGQRGPKGLAGRQTFSRVNTGTPPTPDAGQSQQKTMAPLGAGFLPKTAQLETFMTTTAMPRPTLHDFIKTAMEASATKVDLSLESARQVANSGDVLPGKTKTASAKRSQEVSTEYIDKLASALDYVARSINPKLAEETAEMGPGKGPNSLDTNQGDLPTEDNIDANQTGEATQKPAMDPPTAKLPGQQGDPGGSMETNINMEHAEQPVEPISNEKTSAAYLNNLISLGLVKVAAGKNGKMHFVPANEKVKLAFGAGDVGSYVGSTGGGAAYGGLGGAAKGGLAGGVGGGLLGAGIGGVGGLLTGGLGGAAAGALGGGLVGGAAGGLGGAAIGGGVGAAKGGAKGFMRAREGGKALAAQEAAAQQAAAQQAAMPKAASAKLAARNLMVLGLYKQAEDAINPAQISAGKADAVGAEAPAGASPAEEGVPSEPSDVTSQKSKMLSSNQAAIDYTKRDAKADPKSDMGDVLKEPAQTDSTDKVLDETLEHTDSAGAKISSITRVAAARAILSKLAEEMNGEKKNGDENGEKKNGNGNGKKEKTSMGMAPSTPSEASGFSAGGSM